MVYVVAIKLPVKAPGAISKNQRNRRLKQPIGQFLLLDFDRQTEGSFRHFQITQ